VFNEDFHSLVVSGDEAWDVVDEYVKYVAPHLADRITRWEGSRDAFAEYRIDEQLAKALERKVWLPSGGSLVIDKTEAMTVVDVNTGKFTGQGGNLEETVTRNNLEAAEEIVRQLRLRDVGGIVVIDFIDMVLESNRDLVLRRLLECLSRDRTKHQVAEVTSLGLVQMTRKRVGAGLLEAFSTPCECCNGRGVILTFDPDTDTPTPHHMHAPTRGNGGGNGARTVAAASPALVATRVSPPDATAPEATQPDVLYPDRAPQPDVQAPPTQAPAARRGNGRHRRSQGDNAQPSSAQPDNVRADNGRADNGQSDNGQSDNGAGAVGTAEPGRSASGRRRRRKPTAAAAASGSATATAAPTVPSPAHAPAAPVASVPEPPQAQNGAA